MDFIFNEITLFNIRFCKDKSHPRKRMAFVLQIDDQQKSFTLTILINDRTKHQQQVRKKTDLNTVCSN
jgi:hypothetical protein